ncbi:hypothetical protein DFR50_1221, partial [Roseiarcus fermentans]
RVRLYPAYPSNPRKAHRGRAAPPPQGHTVFVALLLAMTRLAVTSFCNYQGGCPRGAEQGAPWEGARLAHPGGETPPLPLSAVTAARTPGLGVTSFCNSQPRHCEEQSAEAIHDGVCVHFARIAPSSARNEARRTAWRSTSCNSGPAAPGSPRFARDDGVLRRPPWEIRHFVTAKPTSSRGAKRRGDPGGGAKACRMRGVAALQRRRRRPLDRRVALRAPREDGGKRHRSRLGVDDRPSFPRRPKAWVFRHFVTPNPVIARSKAPKQSTTEFASILQGLLRLLLATKLEGRRGGPRAATAAERPLGRFPPGSSTRGSLAMTAFFRRPPWEIRHFVTAKPTSSRGAKRRGDPGGGAKACRMRGVAAQRRRRRPWIAASPFGLLAMTAGSVIALASASTTARHSQGAPRLGCSVTL